MAPAVARRTEQLADAAASLLLGAAVAYALFQLLGATPGDATLVATAAAAGGLAYVASGWLLARVGRTGRRLPVAAVASQPPLDELLLDEICVAPAEDRRVVQLFERSSDEPRRDAHVDDTQALHEALSALRQSLR